MNQPFIYLAMAKVYPFRYPEPTARYYLECVLFRYPGGIVGISGYPKTVRTARVWCKSVVQVHVQVSISITRELEKIRRIVYLKSTYLST